MFGRTAEPDVRVRVRRSIVQVHPEHASITAIVPVPATLHGRNRARVLIQPLPHTPQITITRIKK